MVYGEPGVGKTTLLAGAEKVLFIEVDMNGGTVLRKHPKSADINVFASRTWKDIAQFCVNLPTDKVLKETSVIVVDTVSELQQLDRARQVGKDALLADTWVFNEAIYARNNARILQVGRQLRQTGRSIVWLSHATEEILGEGKAAKKRIRPALSASLLAAMQGNLDGQYYLKKVDGNRVLEFDGEGDVQTKNRFASGRPLRNPTWAQLEPMLTSYMKPTEPIKEIEQT